MVARRGAVRLAHFAHKPPTETCGDPDRGLHEVAKALIVQGFTAALQADGEYRAGFDCEDCGQDVSANVALAGRTIAAERSVVEGTRSDVVIDRGEKPPLIIEVVVSHDPEPATLDRYQQAGVPVFVVEVTWPTVDRLAQGVNADEVFGVPSKQCQRCRAEDERLRRERAGAHAWAESAISGLQADTHPGKEVEIRTWERDKFGHPLAPGVIERIHENAVVLRRLGFVQQTRKPWLFLYQIPRGGGRLYADFGSTEEEPIWADREARALVYCYLNGDADERRHDALIPLVLKRCRRAGASVRVSFYNRHLDDDLILRDDDPDIAAADVEALARYDEDPD